VDVEDVLLEVLRVYSPSGSEAVLEPVMRRLRAELGYDELVIDSAGNYLFVRGSGDRVILLAGHVDTIPGELEVTRGVGTRSGGGERSTRRGLLQLCSSQAPRPKLGPDTGS